MNGKYIDLFLRDRPVYYSIVADEEFPNFWIR